MAEGRASDRGWIRDVHGGKTLCFMVSGQVVALQIRLCRNTIGKQEKQLLLGLLSPRHRSADAAVRRAEPVPDENVYTLQRHVTLFRDDRFGVISEIDVGFAKVIRGLPRRLRGGLRGG